MDYLPLQKYTFKKHIFLLYLLLMSFVASATYSGVYNKELENLIVVDPNKSLSIAQQNLFDTELRADTSGQLIAYYYISLSLSILSDNSIDNYIAKGLALAEKTNNIVFKIEFLGLRANQNELKGDYRAALADANQAMQYVSEINDDRLLAITLSTIAQIQLAIENYDSALKNIEDALAIFKANNDKVNISDTYNSLAIIYSVLGDYDSGIKYYQESERYDETKSPYNTASLYYNLAIAYVSKNEYDVAIEYYNKSMGQSEKVNDKNSLAFVQYGLAEVYLLQNKNIEAEEKLYPVFKIFKSTNDTLMVFNSYLMMSEIQISLKQHAESLMYLDLAGKLVKTLNTPSVKLSFLEKKLEYFEAEEMWKQALELKKQTSEIEKEIQENEKSKVVENIKIRFNAQFDKEEMAYLQQSISQEKRKGLYLSGLMLLIFLAIIMVYFLYRSQRKIKKTLFYLGIESELVQMPSRRETLKILKNYHKNSQLQQEPLAIIMIDLDHFKQLNDTYGFTKGNQVMIHFAKVAKNIMPANGFIGRLGGQEWLLILPNYNIDQINVLLKEIREMYNEPRLVSLPLDYVLHFSSGIMISESNCTDVVKVMKSVDEAMYQAKINGKNQDIMAN